MLFFVHRYKKLSDRKRCNGDEGGTFLPVSTAEFISNLWSPSLPQEDLDEEGLICVGRDHDLLDVRVSRALIAENKVRELSFLSAAAGFVDMVDLGRGRALT